MALCKRSGRYAALDDCLNDSFDNSFALGTIGGICETQHQSSRRNALELWCVIILNRDLRHNSPNTVPIWLAAFGLSGMTSPSDVLAQSSIAKRLRVLFFEFLHNSC